MKVIVFGLGYVGFTAMCCIARSGHKVVGIDISEKKVRAILKGQAPIIEPQVQDMLRDGLEKGLIDADTEISSHLDDADLAIVCVGTPSAPDGSHNMGFIADVSRQIAAALSANRAAPLTVAYRSTIRPGTIEELILPVFRSALGDTEADRLVTLVYNPEFLREGSAVDDYFAPPKIVIGTRDGQPNVAMEELNRGIDSPVFHVGYREAEFTKFMDNTWHAVKVAYANEIGRVCLSLGISAAQVHDIFKSDTKLNISPYYTRPGGAFGGSCLPKDVRALQYLGGDSGTNMPLVDSLLRSNEAHKHRLFEYAIHGLKPGSKVLLAGVAFKAGTDDLRESPNVDLARKLLTAGYELDIYDPAVVADQLVGANLGYAFSHLPTLQRMLVDRETAENRNYDRIIATNATVKDLTLRADADIRDLGTLP
ncbi:nucleotide sugar dehydrogenase [Qingshengfaniella alkalisoli]|uniref:UDP-glucose 6-dehydrogenase n=1 Tax=Qingshengfaniella alkalisoli TaxID=2599296 RepID=A0A5B8IUW7_9RHOB|nr:nucleotide sugar dehydrogenase [Qingshengfaniella alkalisoli]QDY68258.1 nucleotide sugar dehydrogenase [Qingshengfaniella alkalisoli]